MRRICRYLPLVVLLVTCLGVANAQSSIDVNVGFGAAQDKAGPGLDLSTYNNCSSSTSSCASTPDLNNFMISFGANAMLWKHFGIGGEATVQPAKQDYVVLQTASTAGYTDKLQSRLILYDFNGIFQPINTKKTALQLVGGIGGASLRLYESYSGSNALLGNYNSSSYAGNSNHFQVHGGVGVQFYLNDHVFIRPQFDVHYVNNFVQFGRNLVTSETVWVGYTLGEK